MLKIKFTILCALASLTILPCSAFAARILTLKKGENVITSLLLDSKHGYAYAATTSEDFRYSLEQTSAHIVSIRLSDFAAVNHRPMPAGVNPLNAGLLDPKGRYLYFGIYGDPNRSKPAKIMKVRLPGLEFMNTVDIGKDEYGINSSILDSEHGMAYFGTQFGSVATVFTSET